MYSFSDLEPVCCSMSSSNCCFLTCIQISQEAYQVVWYSHPLKNFPQLVVIHTVKGFRVVDETEIDVLLKFPCFCYNSVNVGNLIPSSSSFSKPSLDIWNFLVHIMLKPSLKDFELNVSSMGDECNCLVVWTFFSTALLGNWDEDWPFPVLWPLLGFPNLLTCWVQHFDSIILKLCWNLITSTRFGWLHWVWVTDHTIVVIWVIKIFFCTVLCILSISSWSFLLLLGLHHFGPLLRPFWDAIFLRYIQFSWRNL